MGNQAVLALGVFLSVYAIIISEKVHRTIIALVGCMAVIILGVVSQQDAISHIDFNTLGLLTGMMIIVAVTADTGLFRYIAVLAAKKACGQPLRILIAFGVITAIASAFLDNVTTVLLMVPVTLSITRQLQVNPEPFLITQILASNIGGTATLIGDPPNIMIGSAIKELTFMAFIDNLALVCAVILIVSIAILAVIYRRKMVTTPELQLSLMELDETQELKDKILLKKCLAVLAFTVLGFFTHQFTHIESSVVALTGAAILLLITNKNDHELEKVFHRVEWTTIFFFIGLFVLVGGLVDTGIIQALAQKAVAFTDGDFKATAVLILWLSAIASAFVDNIPFVATMIPLIQKMGSLGITNLEPLWWSLSLGACLGGNGTLIGASANVIVAGLAAQEGHHISFGRFFLIAFPLMLVSIVISHIYIYIRYLI